jgi:protocatechuate 3,4-dioxygenase beta subunit
MSARDSHDDHPHHGLQHDLALMEARIRQRRRALTWLLAGGTAALVSACGGGGSGSTTTSSTGSTGSTGSSGGSTTGGTTTTTTTTGTCIANASETAGPYPGDGSNTVNGMVSNVLTQSGVVRTDIRSSFGSSTTVAQGVPLALTLTVLNSNTSCTPLSGYAVYLWHCTREGGYSLYSNGLLDENFLRGVQVTDANGQCTFQTVYPGCYSGRYPHIHFEVYPSLGMATLYTNKVLTSQIALPAAISSTVYSSATGYSQSVANAAQVSLSNDNVFADNSAAQMALMTPSLSGSVAAGYTGTIIVGVPA